MTRPCPLTPSGLSVDNTAGATANAALGAFNHVGADQPGTSAFVGTDGTILQGTIQDSTPTLENLKSGGSDIFLFGFGTDTLTATTDQNPADGLDPAKTVFTMTLNPDGSVQANDRYHINMIKPIDNLVDVPFGGFTSHVASGHTAIVNDVGGSTIDVRFAGFEDKSNGTSTAVDPFVSQAGVGVGNGQDFNFDDNPGTNNDITDRMRIDFFNDNNNNNLIDTGESATVNRFTFVMNQNNAPGDDGDALVRVYNELGQEVQITGIVINGLHWSVPEVHLCRATILPPAVTSQLWPAAWATSCMA